MTPRRRSGADGHRQSDRFYENDQSLARIVADFLGEGFVRGSPGIVVATATQRAAIIRELTDRSLEVAELQRSDDLLLLDAEEMLSRFMIDGKPDATRFWDQMSAVIERVSRGRTSCTVRIFGQIADVLWRRGAGDAAIRLEVLWNQMAHMGAPSLVCFYAIGNFYKDATFDERDRPSSGSVVARHKASRTAPASDGSRRRLERRRRR